MTINDFREWVVKQKAKAANLFPDEPELISFAVIVLGTFALAWILTGGDAVWIYRIVLLQVAIQIAVEQHVS